MSRRNRLRREAAQLRGRIDRGACLVRQRIGSLMYPIRVLARSPAALPVAFVCGLLTARLHMPGIKCAYGLLAALAGQVNAIQIASSLIGSPVRGDPLTSPAAAPQHQRETEHA